MSRLSFSWLDRAPPLRWVFGLGLCLLLLALDLWQRAPLPAAPRAAWPLTAAETPGRTLVARGGGLIPMPPDTPAAHSSALLPLPADQKVALMAFWFAGTRESAPDVQIACSQFDRASQQWSPASFVVNRRIGWQKLGFALRRLGNPVAWRDAQGRVHLFVVATGLGGWAAGRILHLRQSKAGSDCSRLAFQPMGVLPLSWLWNTSHLVRAVPLALADGGMVLPVYFELGLKYPVALRFNAQGDFIEMVRMSHRGHLLQPTLLARGEQDWLALLRDNGAERKIHAVQTLDGGRHWQDLPDLNMPNPDASVVGLALQPGLMFLAHNPRPESRTELDLSVSSDGLQWTRLMTLASGAAGSEYSYPSMAWADGSLWVSYTDQRRAIAWQRFALAAAAR